MKIEYPKLYKDCLIKHEINFCKNPLFVNIPKNKRLSVWKKIENDYLKKYKEFVRIEFEWSSSGIWLPPFPGSFSMGPMCPVENFFPIPDALAKKLADWVEYRDANSLDDDNFDFVSSNKEGRNIAMEMRKYIPENYYLEYWGFKEIKLQNGLPIELDIPDFLKEYLINDNNKAI